MAPLPNLRRAPRCSAGIEQIGLLVATTQAAAMGLYQAVGFRSFGCEHRVRNGATILVVPLDSNQKRQVRRKSMCGTVLFALGIIGAIASAVTGSIWVLVASVVFLVAGVLMLDQVGKSLP